MEERKWYKEEIKEVAKYFEVNVDLGLSNDMVEKKREKFGPNELETENKQSLIKKFFNQFKNLMVIILLIAAIISGVLGEFKDAVIIFIVVFLNAILGLIQENKAEGALEALKKMTKPTAKVIRNGKTLQIRASELVPGDIVILEAGDHVPADGRLIESMSLKVEESALTGESLPVDKKNYALKGDNISLGDRINMVFSTSMVTYGRGKIIVTETGMNTEIGKIAKLIKSQEKLKTPLQIKLEELGKWLGIISTAICVGIFLIGYFQGREPFEMFMLSVSLAVAAIPEGLPAIVTIVLSLGIQKMIKKNAIIRRLPAVETLGTASVICSDKTGTLTQNKMNVTKVYTYNSLQDVQDVDIKNTDKKLALTIGLLCNDSSIQEESGEKITMGDPTEVALVILAQRKGMYKDVIENEMKRVREIPFDSDRKLMSTIHEYKNRYRVLTKGAPDILINRCEKILINGKEEELNNDMAKKILQVNGELSGKALRVLALAYKDLENLPNEVTSETIENNMIFVGLVGMIDPPREEVKVAVEKCIKSGIKPVMITGDYKLTAMTIAKELGIMKGNDKAIEGKELEKITDEELEANIENYSVYARVAPQHKVRIVKAWQNKGKIVAMTGDGVNDAPSLKRANIGCAMGITGTDVSKEAADMILTDDNFSTIVSAIEEGRTIYDNIRKSIHYLLSCNIGEIVALLIAILMDLPTPLKPIHILWVNLVTDSFPALSLGVDPSESDIMSRKPRNPNESIFANGLGLSIFFKGMIIGLVSLGVFYIGLVNDVKVGRTMAFLTLSFSQFGNSLSVRSLEKSLFKIGILSNKYLIFAILCSTILVLSVILIPTLRIVFDLTILNLKQWLIVLSFSIIPFVVSEIFKILKNK